MFLYGMVQYNTILHVLWEWRWHRLGLDFLLKWHHFSSGSSLHIYHWWHNFSNCHRFSNFTFNKSDPLPFLSPCKVKYKPESLCPDVAHYSASCAAHYLYAVSRAVVLTDGLHSAPISYMWGLSMAGQDRVFTRWFTFDRHVLHLTSMNHRNQIYLVVVCWINSLRPSDAYIHQQTIQNWFR